MISFVILTLLMSFVSSSVVQFEQHFSRELPNGGKHWALIVAGSNGWYNYRHQADVCHAYHILRKHGIPSERIITMMYDDIANNTQNPTPGIIINHPNGKDVYHGVTIDYRQKDVTPENFLAVLSGDEEAMRGKGSGRVIKSGPNDHVFVNFADHGAPGLIAFPYDELHARDLIETINKMYRNKKYQQLVLYIEACESGSMFEGLLSKNISAWATTAANSNESSYACYYDNLRRTYLGDVYSVNWMEDSDKENLNVETLQKQYLIVKNETNTSHVMEYGDLVISHDPVSDFQGGQNAEPVVLPEVPFDAVPSELVVLSVLHRRLIAAQSSDEQKLIRDEMLQLLQLNQRVDDVMKSIVDHVSHDGRQASRLLTVPMYRLTAFDCYEPAVELFDERCFDISQNDHARKQLHTLVNMCEEQIPTEFILEAIAKSCPLHN